MRPGAAGSVRRAAAGLSAGLSAGPAPPPHLRRAALRRGGVGRRHGRQRYGRRAR